MPRTGRPRAPRVTIECAGCSRPIEKRATDVAKSKTGRFFCGQDCPNYATKPRRGADRACETCGESFYVNERSRRRFCSRACTDVWQARESQERLCVNCNTRFIASPASPQKYCSAVCFHGGRVPEIGSTRRTSDGYVVEFVGPDYDGTPNAWGGVLQHRLVMERHLGRPLLPHENVHHKNGVRDDNDLTNLELWTTSQPSGQRVEDKVAWARELLAIYEPLGY